MGLTTQISRPQNAGGLSAGLDPGTKTEKVSVLAFLLAFIIYLFWSEIFPLVAI